MTPRPLDPDRLLAQSAWLRRLALQLAGDANVADDVVQDTLVASLERPPADVGTDGRLRGWLTRVLQNTVRLRRRRDARRAARERAVARGERVDPTAADATIAAQRRLLQALAALPARDREIVVLRFFDDLPPRRIAARLGMTNDAVRSRLSRALAALRLRLAADGDRGALALALLPLLRRGGSAAVVPATTMVLMKGMLMNGKLKALLSVSGLVLGIAWILSTWGEPGVPAAAAPDSARQDVVVAAAADDAASADDAVRAEASAEVASPRRTVVDPAPARAAPPRPQRRLAVVARCVTPDGAPIAGARLIAHEVQGQPAVATDADGRARLELEWPAKLLSGNEHWIMTTATGDGLTSSVQQNAVQGTGDLVVTLGDVVLSPGGDVVGAVVGPDGAPAARATVWAARGVEPTTGVAEEQRRVLGTGFAGLGSGIRAWTTTDDDGRYRLTGLPAVAVSVVAWTTGCGRVYTKPFAIVAGAETRAPVLRCAPLPPANRIAGRVLDAAGAPVPGASVDVFENRGPRNIDPQARAGTGADGRFQVWVLSGRHYTLAVGTQDSGRREQLVHDVAAGTGDLVVQFAPVRTFALLVRGPDGEPVEPTQAWATGDRDIYLQLSWQQQADRTRLPIAPEQRFTVWATAAGCRPGKAGPFEPGLAPATVEIRLERASTVGGRVTADGAPIAGAEVHAHLLDPQGALHKFAHEIYTRLEAALPMRAVTDADGRFELVLQAQGRYVLHAEAEGWARGESAEIAFAPDAAAGAIEIALARPSAIEGRVLTGPDDSAADRIVAATRGDGHVAVCVTGRDAAFRFEGLAPGDWQVRAARPDDQEWLRMARTWPVYEDAQLPTDLVLAPASTAAFDVDLRALHAAGIQGHLAVDGLDAGDWKVSILCGGAYEFAQTRGDGSFAHRTEPGATTIFFIRTLPSGGHLMLQHRTALVAGDNAVDVAVRTGGVELLGLPPSAPGGRDLPAQGYALVWADGRCTYTFDPDAGGAHRAAALPVGTAELRRRDGRQRAENGTRLATVEIVAGQVGRVDVR